MSTETQTRPDLSALDQEARTDIEVAVTQGAVWEHQGGVYWLLRAPPAEAPIIFSSMDWAAFWTNDNDFRRFALPRYTNDPAAWGALMVKERIALVPDNGDGWFAVDLAAEGDDDPVEWWGGESDRPDLLEVAGRVVTVKEPGEAVALAVLAKHGVEIPR